MDPNRAVVNFCSHNLSFVLMVMFLNEGIKNKWMIKLRGEHRSFRFGLLIFENFRFLFSRISGFEKNDDRSFKNYNRNRTNRPLFQFGLFGSLD
jgi:hypothetical protein